MAVNLLLFWHMVIGILEKNLSYAASRSSL